MNIAVGSPNVLKTQREKEKLLVMSNFSFSHSVFKRLLMQTLQNQGLFGKEVRRLPLELLSVTYQYCWNNLNTTLVTWLLTSIVPVQNAFNNSLGECNTILSAYSKYGTYDSVALNQRTVFNELCAKTTLRGSIPNKV